MDFTEFAGFKIKESGGRLTKTKKSVMEVLDLQHVPLGPADIAEKIYKTGGHIDLVTVYRILDSFLELGIVHKIDDEFVKCGHHECHDVNHCHHQFKCKNCSEVEEIHIDDHDFIDRIALEFEGIKIEKHNFVFSGLCKKCNK